MDTLKKVCYCIVALFVILLGAKALKQANGETADYLKDNLVMVSDGKYHQENDGKVVAITGTLETDSYIKDDRFGVWTKNSARLERKVLEYRYYDSNKNSSIGEDRKYDQSLWKKRWENKSSTAQFVDNDAYQLREMIDTLTEDEEIIDVNEEKFTLNPLLNGVFEIPAETLNKFSSNTPVKIETDDEPDQQYYIDNYNYNFIIKNNEYTTVIDETPYVGDIRVSFSSLDLDKLGTVTVVAKQEDGKLVEYKGENEDIVFEVYKGELDKEGIIIKLRQEDKYTKIGVFVSIIIVIIVGLVIFRDNVSEFISKRNIQIEMSENMLQFIIMLVFIGFLAGTIAICANMINTKTRASNGIPVEASVITYKEEYHGDEIGYYYTYEYVVDDQAYQREFNNTNSIPFDPDQENDDGSIAKFEVYYDKDDPSKSYIEEEKHPSIIYYFILLFFIILFIIGAGKSALNIRDNIKKKRVKESK